jgi:hypothetical protein
MMTPDQQRQDALDFCRTSLHHLCKEVVAWVDGGTLDRAPLFRQLVEKCKLFAGVAGGRMVAENMVKMEAMRAYVTKGT